MRLLSDISRVSRPAALQDDSLGACRTWTSHNMEKLFACTVQVVEGRLFSEGLHVLGQPPGEAHMRQYLEAYFDGGLPGAAVDALVAAGTASVDTVRQRLERSFEQVRHPQPSSHRPRQCCLTS